VVAIVGGGSVAGGAVRIVAVSSTLSCGREHPDTTTLSATQTPTRRRRWEVILTV
jgi:hypothetical protein